MFIHLFRKHFETQKCANKLQWSITISISRYVLWFCMTNARQSLCYCHIPSILLNYLAVSGSLRHRRSEMILLRQVWFTL